MFTLTQSLSAIKDKPEFTTKDKGEYTVIDYHIKKDDTFVGNSPEETLILGNLRGTTFNNKMGHIVRLGYHTFFN